MNEWEDEEEWKMTTDGANGTVPVLVTQMCAQQVTPSSVRAQNLVEEQFDWHRII